MNRLPNFKIAALALWEMGGASERVETEDVAAVCWKWAPERFGWKKYPQFPDIRIVAEALRDAKKAKNGELASGDERGGGWTLTPAGVAWIASSPELLSQFAMSSGRSILSRQKEQLLRSLRAHPAFEAWKGGCSANRFTVADASGLTADSPTVVVVSRLNELLSASAVHGDQELQEFIKWLLAQA
ncbi:MAG: hypothetical protein ACR2HN_02065 [Tepidiformaceae bacterium]